MTLMELYLIERALITIGTFMQLEEIEIRKEAQNLIRREINLKKMDPRKGKSKLETQDVSGNPITGD